MTGAAETEFRNATKRYAGHAAVSRLSLAIAPGELCVLVGRSVRELDATELRRRIGYVIQQVGLFLHMTVAGNTAVVPRLLGWPRRRIRDRVDELLELVGLRGPRPEERPEVGVRARARPGGRGKPPDARPPARFPSSPSS